LFRSRAPGASRAHRPRLGLHHGADALAPPPREGLRDPQAGRRGADLLGRPGQERARRPARDGPRRPPVRRLDVAAAPLPREDEALLARRPGALPRAARGRRFEGREAEREEVAVFAWLAFNTLCALPLALLALLARRLPRAAPAVEHLLWLLVLVRLVLPPFSLSLAVPPAGPSTPAIVSSAAPGLGDVLVARVTRVLGPNWSSWGAEVLLGLFLTALLFVIARELLR